MRKIFFLILVIFAATRLEAKLPELTPTKVNTKINEILKAHASYKKLDPQLIQRTLNNYLEELDPSKTYFIKTDIEEWTNSSDETLNTILNQYQEGNFEVFYKIHDKMLEAINRKHELEKKIDMNDLPKKVSLKEFKDMNWAADEKELLDRTKKIKSLQLEAAGKLEPDLKDKSLQRILKHQEKFENNLNNPDTDYRKNLVLSNVLKATTGALDAHTVYFTPEEATQFMINVQQRLFGIGAQLRDDINGLTIVKIIEGGPAANSKELKLKDRIIAVNGEPIVGMDITDAVELIRGPENTPVTLTIIREVGEGDDKKEEKLNIDIKRAEVVLKETRFETDYEPYGDGVIAYLKLFSFYQDPEYSSTADLAKEIAKLKKEHKVKGIILDLRNNTGGMLSQAVGVTGLFIKKGIVVGIKDNTGNVQYLRHIEPDVAWSGPLIVLINRASASASEIVAQALQDYGRALIIGDDHTFGKGSFQTFTLNAGKNEPVNPEGEYKVTRGRYYTVSGKTPQLTGVVSDIEIPGPLSKIDIGEKFGKYPLENDFIPANYEDNMSDIPVSQRQQLMMIYKFDLQKKSDVNYKFLELLKKNSKYRIDKNKNYQAFLKELSREEHLEGEAEEHYGQDDLQLIEAYNIMKDLIQLEK